MAIVHKNLNEPPSSKRTVLQKESYIRAQNIPRHVLAISVLCALILLPSQAWASNNSQTMALVSASIGPLALVKNTDETPIMIDDAALTPSMSPSGSALDTGPTPDTSGQISLYTVREGDTIGSVATMFGVSTATIINANNLKQGASLKVGSQITILPISGREYTVQKGDTLKSIALKYKGVEASDIAYYNDMNPDDELSEGDTIVIPESDIDTLPSKPVKTPTKQPGTTKTGTSIKNIQFAYNAGTPDLGNYWLRPIKVGHMTQDLHGLRHTGVDIGASSGTPIYAAADGIVLIADNSNRYNTGYGNYVVINHVVNGLKVQTLYAHMSKTATSAGASVKKGQLIGYVGTSGRVTGAHLHFEVNGAKNPFAHNPNYGL